MILIRLIEKHERVYCGLALVCGVPLFIFILNMLGINQITSPLEIVVPSLIFFTIMAFYALNKISNNKDVEVS